MKVLIEAAGDPSVGIPSLDLEILIPTHIIDNGDREWIRGELRECFSLILDSRCLVTYEDEIREENIWNQGELTWEAYCRATR